MLKYNTYISVMLVGLILIFTGCQEDEYRLGTLTTPTNVNLTFEVIGVDAENPYGDGSGLVSFSASADNVITFNYIFGDGKDNEVAPDGNVSHVFSKNGVKSM